MAQSFGGGEGEGKGVEGARRGTRAVRGGRNAACGAGGDRALGGAQAEEKGQSCWLSAQAQ